MIGKNYSLFQYSHFLSLCIGKVVLYLSPLLENVMPPGTFNRINMVLFLVDSSISTKDSFIWTVCRWHWNQNRINFQKKRGNGIFTFNHVFYVHDRDIFPNKGKYTGTNVETRRR